MAVYFLRLLGGPVLQGPNGPVTGRASYRRRVALLSILALARGRPVGRERIIGLLWGEHPSDAARHTLSEALYVLRKDLSDDLFVLVGDEVALNAAVMGSDVAVFEEAVEGWRPEDAVRAYAGPLLDGFYVSDAPEFERWVEGERERLGALYGQTLESLALAAEAGGDWAAAAEWWRRLAAHDRYSSRVALRLVRALDAAGDRMAALRFAGAHAVLLREELGSEPDGALAELVARLREEPLRVPAPPPAAAEPAGCTAAAAVAGDPEPAAAAAVAGEPEPEPASAAGAGGGEARSGAAPYGWAPGRARRWPAARTALAAVGVAAGLALALLPLAGAPAEPAPRYDARRIAVLYLDDHSAQGELGYLANGLTEMLIHQLSQVQALEVVSRHGVEPYRDRTVPFDSLAAALRVGSVVEGSVQRSGDSVRVTVQLIDANAQAPLESRSVTYPLDPGSLFALQDAVAGEVAGFLRRRVGREIRLSDLRRRARSPRALELVLRARDAREDAAQLARATHERDVRSALRALGTADSLLALAEQADRDWPEPVLLRGWVGVEQSRLVRGPPQLAVLREARRRAEAVLRREPESVDARELRGTVLWQMAVAAPEAGRGQPWLGQAERDLRAAVAADPTRASAWATLSQLLRLGGDLAEAELAARRVHQEDAYLEVAEMGPERLYRVALALGNYARARHWCGEGRRRFPADFRFRDCALVLLARDPSAPPDADSAWRLLAHGNRLDPPAAALAAGRPYPAVFRRMMVAAVLARAGLGDSARAVAARARRQVRGDADLRANFLWDDAYLALLLGDRARSAALLDSFVAARPAFREYVLREPAFRGVWPR
ncbi:MAG TPA: BTAD domain-containing putative transcriptional regulator [Longimicrobium sp.]|nr:BTAD domain-containing putative transcriptional regulator [Longimicrobium sp.]